MSTGQRLKVGASVGGEQEEASHLLQQRRAGGEKVSNNKLSSMC